MASPGADRCGGGLTVLSTGEFCYLLWKSREPHAVPLVRCDLPGSHCSLPQVFAILSPFPRLQFQHPEVGPTDSFGAPPTLARGRSRGEQKPETAAAAPLRSRSAVTQARSSAGAAAAAVAEASATAPPSGPEPAASLAPASVSRGGSSRHQPSGRAE